ncbi:MAG: hypothetical protein E7370_00770 [Clostridiales bacterium]|nr:hypothetical protein [Clostridiales bacterium]
MSNNKYSKSFQITLSAISCALAVIFLYLGTLNPYLLATGYLMGSVFLMLPLSKSFYLGNALAYLGTCILTLILGASARGWVLVPFIMFFGLHPLANALATRFKINKILAFIIKDIWFCATLFVAYYLVLGGVIGSSQNELFSFLNEYIWLAIPIGGTIFFIVYDAVIIRAQKVVNAFVYKIKK